MAYDVFATYCCYFSTPEKADFAISLVSGGHLQVRMKPSDAAVLFGLTFPPVGGPLPLDGFIFLPPYELNTNIRNPAPSGVLLSGSSDDFVVPGQVIGSGFPNSDVMNVHWSMSIIVRGPEYDGADPTLIAPIPPRRWAMGWEGFTDMELHPNAGTGNRARDASRVLDGIGLKFRGEATTSGVIECALANSEGTGLPSRMSWERIYIRLRTLGATTGSIWQCTGSAATSSGAKLIVNTDGSLTAVNVNNLGVNDATFGTTPALELDTWYKLDIIVKFATGILDGSFRLFVNGTQQISGTMGTGSSGLGQIQTHRSSILMVFAVISTWEIDIDDWHNAEVPSIGGVETLNSIDWLIGTHIKSSLIVSGTATNWLTNGATPLIPVLNQFINPAGSALNLVATVALSTLDMLTNISDFATAEEQEATGINIGPATVAVSINGSQTGGVGNNGRLGYKLAGGAAILTAAGLSGGAFNFTETYLPSGSLVPYSIFPFSVVYEKGPIASSATIVSLTGFAQYIGEWGLEDVEADTPEPPEFGVSILHNCRYPNSAWGVVTAVPIGPVCVVSRRYTGNGTFQTITVPSLFTPPHILIIRNLSSSVQPVVVTTTMMAPESAGGSAGLAGDVPLLQYDSLTGQVTFQVIGDGNRVNQNAIQYEYFMFCDPALRFMINGEFNHGVQTATYNNPIIDGGFLPLFGLFLAGVASPGGFWLKGPSHTGLEVSTINGTIVSDAVQFQLGNLVTQGGISEQNNATAYSLFRTIDGSGLVMVQVVSYVGNGVASRVIPLTPISGRFPLVVFVTRRGGAQGTIYRDAGHAGVNSIQLANGGNQTTGITAGAIDSITVGILLNANGGEYDVLCFPGTSSGWTEGTYCGPNGLPPGDFWDDPPELPPSVGGIQEGGLILGGSPSLSLFKNLSGIYTLVPGKHTDTLYDRQTAQPSVEVAIPDPHFKTGYIGG